MEKTSMQELIELMEKPSIYPVRQEVKEKAIELLEKEKNLFIEIYQDGFEENIRPKHDDAIEYLQSKFENI